MTHTTRPGTVHPAVVIRTSTRPDAHAYVELLMPDHHGHATIARRAQLPTEDKVRDWCLAASAAGARHGMDVEIIDQR